MCILMFSGSAPPPRKPPTQAIVHTLWAKRAGATAVAGVRSHGLSGWFSQTQPLSLQMVQVGFSARPGHHVVGGLNADIFVDLSATRTPVPRSGGRSR
jgi:hypothetical protein